MTNLNIHSENIELGIGVSIHPTASIRGLNGAAKSIRIGDHTYIGQDVQIICDEFTIGDYSKIHHHTNIHGYQSCHIGHNAWIGQYCIIDSIGGVRIGNNCCLGASSHLWSHVKFGDVLEGCRFNAHKQLVLGHDVWIAGHCTITPIRAESKSMALAGSVVTKDMAFNTIYAGNPAENISDKIGLQFQERQIEDKLKQMYELLEQWTGDKSQIRLVNDKDEMNLDDEFIYFNVKDRTYTKKRSASEIDFMKFLLPEKAKYTPI